MARSRTRAPGSPRQPTAGTAGRPLNPLASLRHYSLMRSSTSAATPIAESAGHQSVCPPTGRAMCARLAKKHRSTRLSWPSAPARQRDRRADAGHLVRSSRRCCPISAGAARMFGENANARDWEVLSCAPMRARGISRRTGPRLGAHRIALGTRTACSRCRTGWHRHLPAIVIAARLGTKLHGVVRLRRRRSCPYAKGAPR